MPRIAASSSYPSVVAGRVRRRPATSCEVCRSMKLRCDRKSPCARCARKGAECVYRDANSASLATTLHATHVNGYGTTPDLAARVERLEHIIREQRINAASTVVRDVPKSLPLRHTCDKTRYYGPSHWIGLAKNLSTSVGSFNAVDAEFRVNEEDINSASIVWLGQEVRRSRHKIKNDGADELDGLMADLMAALPKEERVAQALMERYMNTLDCIYRLIESSETYQSLIEIYEPEGSPSARLVDVVRVTLVCALGSTFYSGSDAQHWRRQAGGWIRLAQKAFEGSLQNYSRSIKYYECFCLLFLAKRTTPYCSGTLWLSAGTLLSAAMTMGLHQDPRRYTGLHRDESCQRRRLWAATVELVMQSFLDESLPPLLRPEDFETQEPNEDDEKHYNLLQAELYRSVPLRLKVTRLVTTPSSSLSLDETIELSDELYEFATRASSIVQSFMPNDHFISTFVDILFHRNILLLNMPLMLRSLDSPHLLQARRLCVQSAERIAQYACAGHSSENTSKFPRSDDLAQLWAFGRGSFKGPLGLHIILVLALEISSLQKNDTRRGKAASLHGAEERKRESILRLLDGIQTQLRHAVELGSVNTKAFHILGALLTQFRAYEDAGTPFKHPLESLKETLSTCKAAMESIPPADIANSTQDSFKHAYETLPLDLGDNWDFNMSWDLSALLNIPN